MRIVYSAVICFYGILLQIAALFNPKASFWVKGRKQWKEKLTRALEENTFQHTPIIWFHVSSLGEFEQGRPVIEALKKINPERKIFLTFFSPSGYEIRKNYEYADLVFYLPLDTVANAKFLIEAVRPSMVFFIKYDFWFNYLFKLYQEKIPVFFISAIFRGDQYFFKWYAAWFRRQLSLVSWFFVQNESSLQLLFSIGINQASLVGDTRFDRVYAISRVKKEFPLIRKFCGEGKVFLGGSTWKEDEAVIVSLVEAGIPGMKFIIAPHDTGPGRVNAVMLSFSGKKVLKYSEINQENAASADILIIDNVGILNQLYQYASFAFIGGGFGNGIHNIQEPVTFGVPVFFGPNFHKFREAAELVELGGAYCIQEPQILIQTIRELLADPNRCSQVSSICLQYVEENRGATDKIMTFIQQHD